MTTASTVPPGERVAREVLEMEQAARLARLLRDIRGRNPFYTAKLRAVDVDLDHLRVPDDLDALPFTTKAELVADQSASPPWGTDLSEPLEAYVRYCQTSSTTGRPLKWLDTRENWQWMLECWKGVFRAARVGPEDRIFFPFSFGPYLAFWAAFDAGNQVGALCVPGGGMSSHHRLALLQSMGATVVCCTPTYALRLAEVALDEERHGSVPLAERGVRVLIVAGEPGGSIEATRARIEQSWGARVIDHHGLTEVGPVSFECWEAPGALHLNEAQFIGEVIDPVTDRSVPDGVQGELVLTNLGRTASPVIRYRTGDLVVRRAGLCACGRSWARLDGGILARADDLVSVRGVNVYPSAIEAIVRRLPEVAEFRSTVRRAGALRSLGVDVELYAGADEARTVTRLSEDLREALGLTVPVIVVPAGTLPRFELKARRFVVAPED